MKRGHSNVKAEKTVPWDAPPDCARIPMCGGASVTTCRELPPLALHKDEWLTIGEKMGWTLPNAELVQAVVDLLNTCALNLEDQEDADLKVCRRARAILDEVTKGQ